MTQKNVNNWTFDVRVRERNLRSGSVTDKDIEKYLTQLPDLADQVTSFGISQPALEEPELPEDEDDEEEDEVDVVAAAPAPAPAPVAAAAPAPAPEPVVAPVQEEAPAPVAEPSSEPHE